MAVPLGSAGGQAAAATRAIVASYSRTAAGSLAPYIVRGRSSARWRRGVELVGPGRHHQEAGRHADSVVDRGVAIADGLPVLGDATRASAVSRSNSVRLVDDEDDAIVREVHLAGPAPVAGDGAARGGVVRDPRGRPRGPRVFEQPPHRHTASAARSQQAIPANAPTAPPRATPAVHAPQDSGGEALVDTPPARGECWVAPFTGAMNQAIYLLHGAAPERPADRTTHGVLCTR